MPTSRETSTPTEIVPDQRILVTGFEPFDGHAINSSWEVARALVGAIFPVGQHSAAAQVVGAQLPCRFGAAFNELARLMAHHRPLLVLCLGQAEGRADITLERVAVNLRNARIPDNGGYAPIEEPVVPEGPDTLPSALPLEDLTRDLQALGHRVSISNSAGTFVCNDLFYGLMHVLRDSTVVGGFIHLPILPEQRRGLAERSVDRDDAPLGFGVETPAIALTEQVAAVRAAVRLTLEAICVDARDVA